MRRKEIYTMTEEMLNQIVPVQIFGLEKKPFKESAAFVGNSTEGRSTYAINLLYENLVDPADNTHKFGLLPENPNFLKIKKALDDELVDDIKDYPLEKLSDSLHDMYGGWVLVDMSKTPVCRVYTENVCRMEEKDGRKIPVVVHKAGDPIRKKNPATGEDTEELAIMTQVPVWGFCRKAPNGNWIWLKGNDPLAKIQREINQGRMIYVNQDKPAATVTPEAKAEDAPAEGTEREAKPVGPTPDLGTIGVG
jgi:hypothetical protein